MSETPHLEYLAFKQFREGVNFDTLTQRVAQAMRRSARRHQQRLGALFERDEVTQEQFIEACELEESLHVFVLIGEKPGA